MHYLSYDRSNYQEEVEYILVVSEVADRSQAYNFNQSFNEENYNKD